MPAYHLVRVGCLGHVGRFIASDGTVYPRRSRVVCRTSRGLEVGEVLAPSQDGPTDSDGTLLRRVTVQDELLVERLERRRTAAFAACEKLLRQHDFSAVLMDVEHLFDGQSLFFYFLGEVTPDLERLTAQLAETYEAEVQFRKFTETLTAGCGPDCGTGEPGECGAGCSTCAVASACRQA